MSLILRYKPLVFALAAWACLPDCAEPADPWVFPATGWKEPDFRDRFLGRYGVNGYTEPQMDVDNYNLYEAVLALSDDKAAAVSFLEQGIAKMRETSVEPSAALYFVLGSLCYELGRKEDSIAHYIEAIRAHPSFLRAYANLGFALMEANEPEKALPVLLKVVELGGGEAQVYGLIGHIYLQKKLHASGLTAFQWAMVFNPQNNAWRQGLLRCLIGLERYEEAVGVAEEVLAFERRDASHWVNLAFLLSRLDRFDDALVHLQTAHALGAGTFQTHAHLAALLFNKRLLKEACAEFSAAAALAGSAEELEQLFAPAAELVRADAHELAGTVAAAARERAAALGVALDTVSLGLIDVSRRLAAGDFAGSDAAVAELLRVAPDNGDLQLMLARLRAAQERLPEAIAAYEIAATYDAVAPSAYYEHARILLRQGNISGALGLLRRAQALRPSPDLEAHIRRLEELRR